MRNRLKLDYMKAHRNAYGERMTAAQQQLDRRLTQLGERFNCKASHYIIFSRNEGCLTCYAVSKD